MDFFLQLFGKMTVENVVIAIGALIFLGACYKKVSTYFTSKALRDKAKEDRMQQVIDQAEQYPKWHQQSLDIQGQYNKTFRALEDKLDSANNALGDLRRENSENRANTCRYRILRFDDEIRHDEHHTKEHFDQILEDITEYEKYCDGHPEYKNNKAIMAIGNIKKVYQKCTDERTFL